MNSLKIKIYPNLMVMAFKDQEQIPDLQMSVLRLYVDAAFAAGHDLTGCVIDTPGGDVQIERACELDGRFSFKFL